MTYSVICQRRQSSAQSSLCMDIAYKKEEQEEEDDAKNNAPFDGVRSWTRPPPIRAIGICAGDAAVVTPSKSAEEQLHWRHLLCFRAPAQYGMYKNEARSTTKPAMTRRIKVRKVCTSVNDGPTKVQIRWGEKKK